MSLLEKTSQFSGPILPFDKGMSSTLQQNSLEESSLDIENISLGQVQFFDLGMSSTLQQDSLSTSDLSLEGNIGPQFDLGMDSSLQQDSLEEIPTNSLFADLNGEQGPSFDLGMNSSLQKDSILNQPFSYNGNFFPLSYDLNGEQGPNFDLGKDSILQQTSITEEPSSPLSLNGNKPELFNFGMESTQDPENPIFDTIHEEWLKTPLKDDRPLDIGNDQDLDGGKGFFQGPKYIRDKVNRMSLNSVPGGVTPSAYADINGSNNISTEVPDGAPIPNSLLFHGVNRPTKYQGKQGKTGVDLHLHLLQNPYTYSHGLETVTVPASINSPSNYSYQDLDVDIQNSTPSKYVDRMRADINQYITR